MDTVIQNQQSSEHMRQAITRQKENLQKMRSLISGGLNGKRLSEHQRKMSELLDAMENSEQYMWELACSEPPVVNPNVPPRMTMQYGK